MKMDMLHGSLQHHGGWQGESTSLRKYVRSTIPHLPVEIIQGFLALLNPNDFDAARLVCRSWYYASCSRVFLESHIHKLNGGFAYNGKHCLTHCPCQRRYNLDQLIKMFNSMISEWPGSKFRVSCARIVLDASSVLLHEYLPDVTGAVMTSLDPSMGFECVSFSGTGTFVGLVAGRNAARKLYIYRVFSSKHYTLRSRPHRKSCCPCDLGQGPMYMVMPIKTYPDSPVREVEIVENVDDSSVQEVALTFHNGKCDRYSFGLRDNNGWYFVRVNSKTASQAARASRGRKSLVSSDSMRSITKMNRFFAGIISRIGRFPNGSGMLPPSNIALLDPQYAVCDPNTRVMRVQLPDKHLGFKEEVCFVIRVPVQVENSALIVVTASNGIYVAGQTKNTKETINKDGRMTPETGEVAEVHHYIAAPTAPRNSPVRVTYISASPCLFYDFVQDIYYMGIVVGYSNGEVWFWRVDRAWRDGNKHTETPGDIFSKEVDYKCISTPVVNLKAVGRGTKDEKLETLELVEKKGVYFDEPNSRAWRLAYLPGLMALSFVGRGRVILAADWKSIFCFDLREPYGFEKIRLNVPPPSPWDI